MPLSAINVAAIAREKAAKKLEIKCLKLDSYLPEPGGTDAVVTGTPQSRPVTRPLADCQECVTELAQLEPGDGKTMCALIRLLVSQREIQCVKNKPFQSLLTRVMKKILDRR